MSEGEVVVKEAELISAKKRDKIHSIFDKNAAYFSQNGKHHTKYLSKLFDEYNDNFPSQEKFTDDEKSCEECMNTIIKFWSLILFEIWERKII